jgi:hypothetical protein
VTCHAARIVRKLERMIIVRDYTCDGVPIAQLPTDFLQECLVDGIEINDSDGFVDPVNKVLKRIEIELFIRANNIRG